jgi:hypothetical protein
LVDDGSVKRIRNYKEIIHGNLKFIYLIRDQNKKKRTTFILSRNLLELKIQLEKLYFWFRRFIGRNAVYRRIVFQKKFIDADFLVLSRPLL